jgi:hypothetical protein
VEAVLVVVILHAARDGGIGLAISRRQASGTTVLLADHAHRSGRDAAVAQT